MSRKLKVWGNTFLVYDGLWWIRRTVPVFNNVLKCKMGESKGSTVCLASFWNHKNFVWSWQFSVYLHDTSFIQCPCLTVVIWWTRGRFLSRLKFQVDHLFCKHRLACFSARRCTLRGKSDRDGKIRLVEVSRYHFVYVKKGGVVIFTEMKRIVIFRTKRGRTYCQCVNVQYDCSLRAISRISQQVCIHRSRIIDF